MAGGRAVERRATHSEVAEHRCRWHSAHDRRDAFTVISKGVD